MEEAERVLRTLKPADFVELGAYTQPSPVIVTGMKLSAVMLGYKPDKTRTAKRVQTDPDGWFDCAKVNLLNNAKKFMDRLVHYDKRNMAEKTVESARAILESENFTE